MNKNKKLKYGSKAITTDLTLDSIREKIYQLRHAIMYSMSDEFFTLPNSIVTALQVDDEGQLWFTCQRPGQNILENKYSFPAWLHFYRKGIFYHLEISGKATIMNEVNAGYISNEFSKDKVILVKMIMSSIEYTEPYEKKKKGWLEYFFEQVYNWMLRRIAVHRPSKPSFPKW